MASVPIGFTSTDATAQLAQMSAPQKWQLMCEVNEQAEDTFQQLEGKSTSSFVMTGTQETQDNGMLINIKVRSGFYQEGKRGTELFESDSDFEKRKGISYQVLIGAFRHASSYQEQVAKTQGIEQDLADGTPEELGKWIGRKKFEQAAMTLRERTPSTCRLFANGKTLDSLGSGDILDRQNIIIANGALKRNGGGYANAGGMYNGQLAMNTVAIAPAEALTRLKLDPAYQVAVRDARERGASNPLWDSTVCELDKCSLKEHNGLDHDGQGPTGSVLAPRGFLGTAIAGGETTAFDVTFGDQTTADTTNPFAKWFPGYNYQFTKGDTLALPAITLLGSPAFIHGTAGTTPAVATGGEHYLMIINPPTVGSASEPANAIGFYAYDIGNNGNKITLTRRLGATASGIKVTTLGSSTAPGFANSVVWGAGTYYGKTLTEKHPVGALVLPCNIKGVPFGYVPILGGGGLMRSYGLIRNKRGTEQDEDGFLTKCFIRTYFGHRIRINRIGNSPAVQLLCTAVSDPSLPLPVVP